MMEKSSYAPIVLAAASAPPPLLPFVGPYVLVNAKLSISDDGCCWIYIICICIRVDMVGTNRDKVLTL